MNEETLFWIIGSMTILKYLSDRQSNAVGKLEKIRYVPVYSKNPTFDRPGKLNIGFAKNRSGVYLIKENSETVYVGQSRTNLYRTVSRHFQVWNDRGKERIAYDGNLNRYRYTVRIVFVSPARALKLEEALIRKHRPRDNQAKMNLLFSEEEMSPGMKNVLDEYEKQFTDIVPF